MIVFKVILALVCMNSLSADDTDEAGSSVSDYVPYMSLANREMNGASKALFYDFFPSNLVTEKPTLLEIRSLFSVSTK